MPAFGGQPLNVMYAAQLIGFSLLSLKSFKGCTAKPRKEYFFIGSTKV